jgi:hypothetical protein
MGKRVIWKIDHISQFYFEKKLWKKKGKTLKWFSGKEENGNDLWFKK